MSVKIMAQVWELDLPSTCKFVLLALADHADDDGGNVFPSVALIAWKVGQGERTVQRWMARLRTMGLLVPVAYRTGGQGHATEYWIDISKGAKLTPFRPVAVKGDVGVGRGDIDDTERVTVGAQRVTRESAKGDMGVTLTISEPSDESSNESSGQPTRAREIWIKVQRQLRRDLDSEIYDAYIIATVCDSDTSVLDKTLWRLDIVAPNEFVQTKLLNGLWPDLQGAAEKCGAIVQEVGLA